MSKCGCSRPACDWPTCCGSISSFLEAVPIRPDPTQGLELTTPRCVLRPIATADVDRLHRLWTSAGVRRFLWDDEVISHDRTRAAIEQSEQMFERQAFGLWGAWLKDSPSLCGF